MQAEMKMMPESETTAQQTGDVVRMSVSVDAIDYAELKEVAEEKRVSIAWVVRDAVATYLDARTPLFARKDRKRGS